MSFSRFFRLFSIILATLVAYSFAAKTTYGKVRSRIGDVGLQKPNTSEWVEPHVGTKVHEGDLLRTMMESQVIVGLPDGSSISIEENSIVSMSELISEDGKNISTTDIKKGKVRFDVQKQANKESSIKFKTGTAVAAIRGTEGIIGHSRNGKLIASLRTGQLEIFTGNKATTINGGQTAVPKGEELVVLDLVSSGTTDFFDELDEILSDSTTNVDSLEKVITEKDSLLTHMKDELKGKVKCDFAPLPDKVADTLVVVKGKCAAADTVEIAGEKQASNGNEMEFKPTWDVGAIGEKKFAVTCQIGKLRIHCGQLNTFYVGKAKEEETIDSTLRAPLLTVATQSPISVSNPAAFTIEGSFNTGDPAATLFVKMGAYTSPNLVPLSANGSFTHTVNVSEKKGNWNEKNVSVEYNSSKLGSKTITLDLDVDKTSKLVNTEKPFIAVNSADSLKCYAKLTLNNSKGDDVIYKSIIDDETTIESSHYKSNASIRQELTSGVHRYAFTAEDQAGNIHQVTKTLGCFPPRKHTLEITGGNTYERIRSPKPPQGYSSNTIYRNLTFKITNIPNNDPRYIKMITISQKGKSNVILRPTDFQSNIFDHQVELPHGAKTDITIKVIMKNGSILSATKTYEVR